MIGESAFISSLRNGLTDTDRHAHQFLRLSEQPPPQSAPSLPAPPNARPDHVRSVGAAWTPVDQCSSYSTAPSGGTFWLRRRMLCGSNRVFNACSRSNVSAPNAARKRSIGSSACM
jgi:hypothetical protein